jgi:hypothetical protein
LDQGKLIEFLTRLQDAFLDGRMEELGSLVTLPLVVYTVAGVTVLRTPDEMTEMAVEYRGAIVGLSVTQSRIELVEWSAPVNRRVRALARTVDFDATGRFVTSSLVRYFLVETDAGFRIEMMEYLEAPLPPDEVERLVH